MPRYLYIAKILLSYSLVGVFFCTNIVLANSSQYPNDDKSKKEMGSVFGDEGIVFRWGKEKSNNAKNIDNISYKNKLLVWKAALAKLQTYPISYVDFDNGYIVTDWYNSKNKKNLLNKIQITIIPEKNIDKVLSVNFFIRTKPTGVIHDDSIQAKSFKKTIYSSIK